RWRSAGGAVAGHSDVAPPRKADPGDLFSRATRAAAGHGCWPRWSWGLEPAEVRARAASGRIGYGYRDRDFPAVLRAIQGRDRAHRIDGLLDAETMGLLAAVADRS